MKETWRKKENKKERQYDVLYVMGKKKPPNETHLDGDKKNGLTGGNISKVKILPSLQMTGE